MYNTTVQHTHKFMLRQILHESKGFKCERTELLN
jgi:hypothetical protein